MKKALVARGFLGLLSLVGVSAGLVACGADVGDPSAETEIGSNEQAIRIAGLNTSNYDALFPAVVKFDANTIFVVGGLDSTGAGILTAKKYDKSTGNWTALASLPANKQRGKAEIRVIPGTNSRYYLLAGGVDGTTELSDALIYDKTNDAWTAVAGNGGTLTANMNSVRFGFGMEPCGTASKLIALGGMDTEVTFSTTGASSSTNTIDVFEFDSVNISQSGWHPLKDNTPATLNLTTARGYHGTFAISATEFHLAGGLTTAANGALKSVEKITVNNSCAAAASAAGPNMTITIGGVATDFPRAKFASFLYSNGKYIVAGGMTDKTATTVPTQALAYDPAGASWSQAGALTTGRLFPLSSDDPHSAGTFAVAGGAVPSIVSSAIVELHNSVNDVDRYAGETGTTAWARPLYNGLATGLSVTRVGGWLANLNSTLIYGHGMTAVNSANTFRQSPE